MSLVYDSFTHNLDQPKPSAFSSLCRWPVLLAVTVSQTAGFCFFVSSVFSSLLKPVNVTPCVCYSWYSVATESLWAALPETNEVLSVWLKKGVQTKTSILDKVKIETHYPLHPPSFWLLRGDMNEVTWEHGVHVRNTPTLAFISYLFSRISLQIMDKSGEQEKGWFTTLQV